MGLDLGSIFRRCHLLSIQPTMVVGMTQGRINTKIQFSCSYNLETYHRIYLWIIPASFLHFQSLFRFMKSQFIVTSSLLMKSSFLFSQTFNKKCNSYINFFLVLCFTPFVADVTFITLLLSNLRLRVFLPTV